MRLFRFTRPASRSVDAPPDVRWPVRRCPMCNTHLVVDGGWVCQPCGVVWLFDGTAGEWIEPREEAA